LIIEDERLFAEAIEMMLRGRGLTDVTVTCSGQEGLASATVEAPDVALVDLGLPDMSGLDVGRQLLRLVPGARLVALTAVSDPDIAREVMRAGFHAYLTKQLSLNELIAGIDAAAAGRRLPVQGLASRAAAPGTSGERLVPSRTPGDVTPQERRVLELLACGASSEAVAASLGISRHTVRTHVQNILGKLQAHSRLEAVAVAVRQGIIAPHTMGRQDR
jgi:DNA-binding NarL/FixJ family response regulator